MLSDEIVDKIFNENFERVEENIQKEYHQKIKEIKNIEERENIKLSIISELYYKEGFKDGINFVSNYIQKI